MDDVTSYLENEETVPTTDASENIPQHQKRKKKGIADIVFCIDVSGSMTPCVQGIKDNLEVFFEQIANNPNRPVQWRARIVTFSDLDCDPKDAALDGSFPFTNNVEEIQSKIASLQTIIDKQYGGDEPESSLDAIFTAVKDTEWQPLGEAQRFVVVFTDAPPKVELHDSTVEENQDKSVNEVVNTCMNQKVILYIWGPEHEAFQQLAKIPKSDFTAIGQPGEESRYEGLKNQDFTKLCEQLGKTISMATLG